MRIPFRRRREIVECEYELPISMIDVVFLLLIFFMCVSKFRSPEQKLDVHLPRDEGPPSHRRPVEIEEIRVRLWEEAGVTRMMANEVACGTIDELAALLTSLTRRLPGLAVVIDARQNVQFRYVIGAIDACKRAEIADVKFQAPPVAGGGGDDWWYR